MGKLAEFAKAAHGDQMYGEVEYWHHLRDVKNMTQQILHPDSTDNFRGDCHKAAWCHDMLEDTEVTFQELDERLGYLAGFAVDYLTKRSQSREYYILQITHQSIEGNYSARVALVVKIADSMCNLRETLKEPKPNLRRVMKYTKNLSEMIPVAKRLNLLKPKRFL